MTKARAERPSEEPHSAPSDQKPPPTHTAGQGTSRKERRSDPRVQQGICKEMHRVYGSNPPADSHNPPQHSTTKSNSNREKPKRRLILLLSREGRGSADLSGGSGGRWGGTAWSCGLVRGCLLPQGLMGVVVLRMFCFTCCCGLK